MKIAVHRIPARSCKVKGRSMAVFVGWATVDDDQQRLTELFWTVSDGYPTTRINGRTVFMHYMVLGRNSRFDISHENADKFDNRRDNLLWRTRSQNMLNTADRLHRNNTSGFRGVTRDDANRRLARPWRGKVWVNGMHYQTTRCASEIEAAVRLNQLRESLGIPPDLRIREMPRGTL